MQYENFILKCGKIEIRNLKMKYLDDFHAYASQKEVGPQAGWKPHKTIKQSKSILKDFIESKLEYGIYLEDKLIGLIGVYEDDYLFDKPEFEGKSGVEIGYSLNKNYWGRGIMTDVVKCFVNHLINDLDYDYISCSCFVDNKRSLRVIEKSGFKFFAEHFFVNYDGNKKPCYYYYIENFKEG
ncbi:GNAT family N-acetyltransferase [uncultured Finegoldia sp.]|uniref:GNAT family N-acetyltransferase n=1 Tax=uncultured Finegoldia sp. TaxID=328009 RepID=UPI0026303697|nr:GNAT family N-acetyltransferase [uncultured Finegoldia sp.]